MGQDLHITRSQDWTETGTLAISEAEWRSLVESDAELAADPENGPNAAVWTAHPDGGGDAWLDWSAGNVYTTDADEALLDKMYKIAEQLAARVVDDENRPRVKESDQVL